jgi:hypothetical protein
MHCINLHERRVREVLDSTVLLLRRSLNQTAKPASIHDGSCEIPAGKYLSNQLHLRLVKNTETGFMKCVKWIDTEKERRTHHSGVCLLLSFTYSR